MPTWRRSGPRFAGPAPDCSWPPCSSTGLTFVLRALRWQYILAPLGETHFSNAFQATVIGFAASFLLPARAGEVIRPLLLARREGLPATATFATIILERLMDMVTVLALFAVFVLTADPATMSAHRPTSRGSRPEDCWPRPSPPSP